MLAGKIFSGLFFPGSCRKFYAGGLGNFFKGFSKKFSKNILHHAQINLGKKSKSALKKISAPGIFLIFIRVPEHAGDCDGSPPQGPSRGTAGQITGFVHCPVIDPPRGRPAGETIVASARIGWRRFSSENLGLRRRLSHCDLKVKRRLQ